MLAWRPDGELEIWLNEQGRDQLVRELMALSETSEHFHLASFDGAEVKVSGRPYRATDSILHVGKVMLRPDQWNRTHFPYSIQDSADEGP